jgi:hypothetical protein
MILSITSCSLTPPLTPEQEKTQEIESAKAINYFSNKILITDSGGKDIGFSAIKIESVDNGHMVRYYSSGKSEPLFEDKVVKCIGNLSLNPNLNCELYNGVNRRVRLKITQVSEDTVVKDPRLISLQDTIIVKKGTLLVETQWSPTYYQLAGVLEQ